MREILDYGREAAELPQDVVQPGVNETSSPTRESVDPAAFAAVEKKVKRFISLARQAGYRYAADNLQHWYDGSGAEKRMPAAALEKDAALIAHLKADHLKAYTLGAQKRAKSGELQPGGSITMTRRSSMSAPEGTELYFALGGFVVDSTMTVTAMDIPEDPQNLLVHIDRWSVEVSDYYNFDKMKIAFIPLFGPVEDEEIDTLRRGGKAENYPIKGSFVVIQQGGMREFTVPKN